MVHKSNRPTVHDIRAIKARGQKISMLYVTTLEEAAAADAAGIDMLSIESRFFSPEMREAAGRCFVQVGLPFGPYGQLATAEDYLRAAFKFTAMGGDCFYCAASLDIQKVLCDNHVPIVAHVGLIPSYVSWTGWRAVGKTATEARAVWDHVKQLEASARAAFGETMRLVVFGHVGDGNLHIILGAQPFTPDTRHRIEELVYTALIPHRGSISAEHGIGLEKRDWLQISRSPEEIALMRSLKTALDPKNILNPGKVLA